MMENAMSSTHLFENKSSLVDLQHHETFGAFEWKQTFNTRKPLANLSNKGTYGRPLTLKDKTER